MQRHTVIIRDGGAIDIARTGPMLRRCLAASPELYPTEIASAYCEYLGPAILRGFLDAGGHLIIAERDQRLVGFTCGVPDSARTGFGTYYCAWVVVDLDSRLEGIGSRLLHALEARAFAADCHKVYSLVRTANTPALRFFQRAGHHAEAILRRHWNGYDFYFMSHLVEQWHADGN